MAADGQWAKAAEKFNEVIVKYPTSQDVDASLYWLAFALKKQNKFELADDTIGQLIFKFPQSPWIKDAMSIRIEMSFNLSKFEFASNSAAASDDEARVIALKNVFRANAEQGVATATDILKPGSTASRTLKEAAITLIGLSEEKGAPAILMGIVHNEPDLRLRKAAIMALRWNKDEAASLFLKDLLLNAETDDIALSALFIVSEQQGRATQDLLAEASRSAKLPRVRQEAVVRLGQQGDSSIDKLMEICRGSTDVEIKRHVPLALARTRSSRAQASLYELACSADDVEVRKRAAHVFVATCDAPNYAQQKIEIDGKDLTSKLEAALHRGLAQSSRYWVAYAFDVAPGVAIDADIPNPNGSRSHFYGMVTSAEPRFQTRNLGVFMLHDPEDVNAGAVVQVELYNLDRKRDYQNYPVSWLGHVPAQESLTFLKKLVELSSLSKVYESATIALAVHDDPTVGPLLEDLIRGSGDPRGGRNGAVLAQ